MERRDPREYYLVDTRTSSTALPGRKNPGRDWKDLNLTANTEFAELAGMNGKLLRDATVDSGLPPQIRSQARNFHDMTHMTPEVFQYATERNDKGESTGLIWIPKEKKEDAKRIFKALKKVDKEIDWNPMGLSMTAEELLAPAPPASPVRQPNLKK